MFRGGKSAAEEKGYRPKSTTKRRLSSLESQPLTALEYFIYACAFIFVGVFAVVQGVFLFKLNFYEASREESRNPLGGNNQRSLLGESTDLAVFSSGKPIAGMSNRHRIEAMANATRREFTYWPPLDAIVAEDQLTGGNPQFLLDFAVLGFEKAGTNTLKLMMSGHKELLCPMQENYKLFINKPQDFIADMYGMHTGEDYKRCYSNNGDVYQPSSLEHIHKHFPETKLIVAIRHPIRLFESLYNARIQNLPDPNKKIPSPQERIGICQPQHNGACTDHAHLALWLYKFGKTLTMPEAEIEDIIKNTHSLETEQSSWPTTNKIFLVETSQLIDQDWFRQQELMDDLQAFLGLKNSFMNGIPPAHPAPTSDTQVIRDKRKIDICQDQYKNLREELMQGARESSLWIRERLTKSQDVFVSSPDFFEQALMSWMEDPCNPKANIKDKEFDTKTIESEIAFQAEDQPLLPVTPGELTKFDTSETWPALSEVVDDNDRLIGDPQFLLDFAIIGIEKCGTSTLMKWLGAHPDITCFQNEDTSIFDNSPGLLAKRLYKKYPGEKYKRGYKNPIDLFQPCASRIFQEIFPQTKLLVTLRHPVRYFESLHNFRIQNLPDPNDEFTPVLDRIGVCQQHSQGLCTDHAHFALWLYRLGKTVDMPKTDIQNRITEVHPWDARHATFPSTNKVFLTEMTQFMDNDETRNEALKQDLATFLELQHTFDQKAPHIVPGKVWSEESQEIRDSRKIDICEEQYRPLRDELMKGARESSVWIRTYFLASTDVFVSSPEYFEQAMRAWMTDPCEDESQQDPRALSNWPPLSALVNDEGAVIGDPQFLLDFAIIGVEKCGTSTLMIWLGGHPELQCPQEENYSLMSDNPGQLVQDAYAMAPYEDFKRGYKNPVDLFYPGTSMKYLDQYFPKTRLIVTLRNPIRYFESLYNFRIQNHNQGNWERSHINTPFERIGQCIDGSSDGCTEHAHFGLWLYRLGKTLSLPDSEMQRAFAEATPHGTIKLGPVKRMENPIFLTEMTQFADKDAARQTMLKEDLRDFLGLTENFSSGAPHKKPGKVWTSDIQTVRDSFKIDICREEFQPVRDVLLKGARETSAWIRESFIKAPDVYISSPEFFEDAMLAWMDDPCDELQQR